MINSPMLFPYKNIVNACIATITQLIINKNKFKIFFHFHFSFFLTFYINYQMVNFIYYFLPNSPFLIYQHFFEGIHKSLPKSDINALIRMLKAKLSKKYSIINSITFLIIIIFISLIVICGKSGQPCIRRKCP